MIRFPFLLTLVHLLLCATTGSAQELRFSIAEFEQNPLDMTAKEMNKDDGDGHAYAIIKVTSDNEDDDLSKFNFDFSYIKSEKEMRDGQLWIYVARNAKNVTIRRDGYKPIINHQIKAIKEGMTYNMRLTVQTPKVMHRVLQFMIDPANENAIVKVKPEGASNYELWGNVDATGSANRLLETGVYLYEVSADNYLTSQGRVLLSPSSSDENFIEKVKLTPNFGFLEIDNTHGISGAEVYINNRKVGTVPYRSNRMECRDDYQLMISNGELYKTYNATFAIARGETTKLSPRLESNFAETTIKVDNNAEIFINGVSKGRGTWVGPLRAGTYNVECRLTNHTPSAKQIVVKPDFSETFLIDAPKPIEGTLYVTSNPAGAKIFIDDKDAGFVTPRSISNVLIGRHKVTVMLANHRTETREVNIRQGETTKLELTLSDMANMTIESTPTTARLYINDKYVGVTPYKDEMASGDYKIRIEKPKYRTFTKTVHFDSSNPVQKFSLSRQYQSKNQFYLQPTFQFGSTTSAGISLGCYFGNVNIEADYLYGLDKETIYWNSTTDIHYSKYYDKEELSPVYAGVKFGYGIISGSRMRITPQLGFGSVMVGGSCSESNSTTGSLGVCLDYAVANHISLVAVPEYSFSISESDTYKLLSGVSSKIKGWANGFNIRLGLSFNF